MCRRRVTHRGEPLPQPGVYPAGRYYPTRGSVHYDAARKEYTIALEGMVKR